MSNICIIGMWHLGCVTAGCLSNWHNVICYDNPEVIKELKAGKLPIYEPQLDNLFRANDIRFTTDLKHAVSNADFVYVTYDVPVDNEDKIKTISTYKVIYDAMPYLSKDVVIIISSQVPVGTCDIILRRIREAGKKNEICYIPENLQLGKAVECFLKPDRLVIGMSSPMIKGKIEGLFEGVISSNKDAAQEGVLVYTGIKSAEMVKHTLNAYLATLISFSGEISDLCEKVGANAVDVMNALKSDSRVSNKAPIMPGLGFSGGTLERDVQVLRRLGVTELMDAVMLANDKRKWYVINKLLALRMPKRIAFFGLTYKAGTDTLRGSPTLKVVDQLQSEDVTINIYDPMHKDMNTYQTAEETAKHSDVIVIMTDWPEFKKLDYKNFGIPVIDTRNMLDDVEGIEYYGVGI